MGIGVGLLIGSNKGGETRTTVGEAAGPAVTHTVVHTTPPTTKVEVRTHTVTVTKATPPPPTREGGEGSGSGANYEGSGAKTIGTVSVPRDATLHWTCEGACGKFSIFSSPEDENRISLATGGHTGSAKLPAGAYHEVRVTTSGRWTIKIE